MAELETGLAVFLGIWAVVYLVGRLGRLRTRGFQVKPFFIMYKTDKVERWLGGIAKRARFWRAFANFSVGLGVILMIGAVAFLVSNLLASLQTGGQFSPLTLLIPGLTIRGTESLLYFFLSVPIILVVHEGAHGVVAILEKIKIKSGGFGALAVLLAGFVEPDEEEFKKAKPSSRLRILGAGSSSNVVFSFLVAALLLIHPFFGFVLPSPVRSVFYDEASGFLITGIAEGSGADIAGIRSDDVITHIKGVPVTSREDFARAGLKPGETVNVEVLRGGQRLVFQVVTTASTEPPVRGVLGIGSGFTYYPPKISLGVNWPTPVMLFLFWLWFLSFNIGLFNMLPFYPLDGDGFFNALLGARLSEANRQVVRASVNGFALTLLAANLITSFVRFGAITV